MAGTCVNKPLNDTLNNTKQTLVNEAAAKQIGQDTIIAGNLVIHHHHVSLPVCKTGACCDIKKLEVLEKGKNCTEKVCYMGNCDGEHSECEYSPSPSGTPCPDGYCFDGVCVKNCLGMCCDDDDDTKPKEDGLPCADGFCFRGTCIKNCEGECCEPLELFADSRAEHYKNKRFGVKPNYGTFLQAKVDGSPCNGNNGYCVKGECTAFTVPAYHPKENNRPEIVPHDADVKLFIESFKERFVKNFFMSAAKVENDQIDDEDLEYLKRKLAKEQDAVKQQRTLSINATATSEAELLAAANATEGTTWASRIFNRNVLFYFIVAIAAIAIIACIAKIVSSRRRSKKGEEYESLKKQDDDYDF
jgi:hypothetical protein